MAESKTLNSGLRLAVQTMKGFEGVAFKIYVCTGSMNEINKKDYGISHLIEHMMFKGTKTRSAYEINYELDKLGIVSNAFTSKETTCYYTNGIKDTLEKSMEIFSDMFFNSTFDEEELEKEKQVIIEEINMYQDNPSAVCEMSLDSIMFKGLTASHDIAGEAEIVAKITRQQILDYINKFYTPKNVIISVAGDVTIDEVEKLVNKYFESNFKQKENFVYEQKKSNIQIEVEQIKTKKDIKQANLMIAYKLNDNLYSGEGRNIVALLTTILGGGMSSRLFQEVREKLGLVYTIYCGVNDADNESYIYVALGTNPKKVPLALKTIRCVIEDVVKNGVTIEELNQAKAMYISSKKLASDSVSGQAKRIANELRFKNKLSSKEDLLKSYENITLSQVNNKAKEIFENTPYCISMVAKNIDIDLLKLYDIKSKECKKEIEQTLKY